MPKFKDEEEVGKEQELILDALRDTELLDRHDAPYDSPGILITRPSLHRRIGGQDSSWTFQPTHSDSVTPFL